MEKLSFRLEKFEGPLDALIYLISKNKLNIYDISISELLDQYLAYLGEMRSMDLEITSDFLEMASRLVQIKSSMLLPKTEDEQDQAKDLITSLIEYKTCKALAEMLKTRMEGFDAYARAPEQIEQDNTYNLIHSPNDLLKAFCTVNIKLKKHSAPAEEAFKKIVCGKIVSVASRVVHILKLLVKTGRKPFYSLFQGSRGRSEAVATFLAVLELIRAGRITANEDNSEITFAGRRKIGNHAGGLTGGYKIH